MSKDLLTLNAILLIIPAGLYFVLWEPLFSGVGLQAYSPASETSSINAFRGQINEYDKTAKDSKDIIGKYARLRDSYNAVDKTILKTIEKSIPDTVEDLPFVSEMTKLIQKQGLDPGVITLSPGPDLNGMKVLTFTFTTKGSYESLKNLIQTLEKNVRFMAFRSLTLTPPDDSVSPYTLRASVDIYKLR